MLAFSLAEHFLWLFTHLVIANDCGGPKLKEVAVKVSDCMNWRRGQSTIDHGFTSNSDTWAVEQGAERITRMADRGRLAAQSK